MVHRIVRIDVHKGMLAVVVADVGSEGEYRFGKRKFGASPGQLRRLAEWLIQQEVEGAVTESTTQHWKPVWQPLERYWQPARRKQEGAPPSAGMLHLAQAKSNRGPRGRKNDFADGERLVKRLVGGRTGSEFRARSRTTSVADGDTPEVPIDPRPVVAAGGGQRKNRPGSTGRPG